MLTDTHPVIRRSHLELSMIYGQYSQLLDSLVQNHRTTGPDQSEFMVKYTELNRQRMRKWDKIAVLDEGLRRKLGQVTKPMVWLVLTEAWCGDAAQNIPVIAKMAEANPAISLRFLLRDEHLDIMDNYLTGGSRAIPKLIALDAGTLEELGTWGPRPAVVQAMATLHKNHPDGTTKEEFYERIHAWYAHDKTRHVQQEFERLLGVWTER